MSTPARSTRAQTRSQTRSISGSQEPSPSPVAASRRAGSRAASVAGNSGNKKKGGLAPKTSSAYGGMAGAATAERTSAAEGSAGFAAGFSGQREEAMRLSPVREEQEELVDLAPPVVAVRERSASPVVPVREATGPHGSTGSRPVLSILVAIMGLITTLAAANYALPYFGYEVVACGGNAGAAPSTTALYNRLYGDLHQSLWAKLSRTPPSPALGKPADKLPDAPDHNHLGLHHVDHFSFHRGAIINPVLTSDSAPMAGERLDTRQQQLQRLPWFAPAKWLGRFFKRDTTRWPVEAIVPWTEAGQCWCAQEGPAPPLHPNLEPQMTSDRIWFNQHGGVGDPRSLSLPGSPRAQLSLVMPQAIYPSHAVIEHIPPQGTSDIRSAPEWIELWAQVSSKDDSDRVWAAYSAASGDRSRPFPEYTKGEVARYGNNVPGARSRRSNGLVNQLWALFRRLDANTQQTPYAGPLALNESWVRVARFRYDIHAAKHAQQVKIPVDFQRLGIPVSRMTVRVRSNYGQDYTCMYRVRMLGEMVDSS